MAVRGRGAVARDGGTDRHGRDDVAALRTLAKHHGVQGSWRDAGGVRRVVDDAVLTAILGARGVAVERAADAPERLRYARDERLRQLVEPVVVLWDGDALRLPVRLPSADASGAFGLRVEMEDGTVVECDRRQCRMGAPRRDGLNHVVMTVEPPARVPFGVHRLVLSRPGHPDAQTHVIAAPSQLRELPPGEQRRWGVFAPLYALYDAQRPVGDLSLLERLSAWGARHATGAVATLPLLAAFVGAGSEPTATSPYSPVSRRYWNEAYLDVASIPELGAGGAPCMERPDLARAAPAGGAGLFDLPAAAAARRDALEAALERLASLPRRADAFAAWRARHGEVDAYARFRAAVERGGLPGDVRRVGPTDPAVRYHAYVQFLADEQLRALASSLEARRQALYLDLPLGVHAGGFDPLAHGTLFATGARVGAPPDALNPAGQDWGAPPVDPAVARAQGHAEFRAALRAHLAVAGMLRIDHVMGLHRLWWVPAGAGPADGAYVRYPADELYALLCLEAHRHGALIVGEDLGTVPHETKRSLQAHRMLGMYVVPFELRDDGLPPPGRRTLAALDTHGTVTFARWWHDLEPARRAALLATLRELELLDPDLGELVAPAEVLRALLGYLGASRAEIVLVALEDLWLETEQQNDPATGARQRADFGRRAARSLDELEADDTIAALLDRLAVARRRGLVGV